MGSALRDHLMLTHPPEHQMQLCDNVRVEALSISQPNDEVIQHLEWTG